MLLTVAHFDFPYQAQAARAQPVGRRLAFVVFLGLDFPLFPVRHAVHCQDCGSLSRM